ncbi:nitrite reductase large subunit NirB [Cytobacillus kochii]
MHKEKIVLVGNGMAGVRCIEEIIKNEPERYSITIFGSEKHVNYNRILLSSVIQGETSINDIFIHPFEWYQHNNIQLFTGETVVHIDTNIQSVSTDKARKVTYDKLILATGSNPFILPIPGSNKEGVLTLRTIEDCQKILIHSNKYKKAVVIGGGLLGLEAARGLLHLGMEVKVVHLSHSIMERQLDTTASKYLQKELENQGISFLLKKETNYIVGEDRVEKVVFKDGTEIEADIVIMAAGVRPNCKLAKENGILTNRGIIVNDLMETNIPNIYAIGECAEHRGTVYGIVKPLYEQGEVLAKHICGKPTKGFRGSVLSTKLKISSVDVFSAGDLNEKPFSQTLTLFDELDQVYKKFVFQHNKIVGAVLYGDISDHTRLLDMIVKKTDFTETEKALLLDSSNENKSSITEMSHSSIVCNCNNVTKETIMQAVTLKSLSNVEEVKQCTRASSSCGGCKSLVEELLTYMNSDDFSEDILPQAMCSCTTLTEDEVVEEIQNRGLKSIAEVMAVLDWKKKEGCQTCFAALNYYLVMIHLDYEQSESTIYVNEMMNATVQEDGTYSIVPQMYGGMTNGKQLRRIADVAEKYQVSTIMMTADQRIQLRGIRKESLINICKDLNMKLMPFQGNNFASITAYEDDDDCHAEKVKLLNFSIQLEKNVEFLMTPYRMEIGVAPYKHNRSCFASKDIKIIKQDDSWEIYISGNEGKNRIEELLTAAQPDDEALSILCAFFQYYRETARYTERTLKWAERIGFIHIREVLFDQELRRTLLQRLADDKLKIKKMESLHA